MIDEKEIKEVQPDPAVMESPTEASKTNQEKTLTQTDVNKLMADERRKHDSKYNELKSEYTTFKSSIEAKEQAANDAAAEKVSTLRKDLPESVTKLLDKLSAVEQLEWLIDPENVITKKEIPPLPNGRENNNPQRRTQSII